MLRPLILLLTLANLVLLAANEGWFGQPGGEREPERIAQQVNPERIKVMPAHAASSGLAEPAHTETPAPAATATPPIPILSCLESGPYAGADLASAEKSLHAALSATSWTAIPIERAGVWMIYMGRYPDDETRERKKNELERRATKFQEVNSPAEFSRGLSLGRFPSRAEADAGLAALNRRGVRTARVVAYAAPVTTKVLRIDKADVALEGKLKSLGLPMPFVPCEVPAGSLAASAAAASASGVAPGGASAAQPATATSATPTATPAATPATTPTPASSGR